MFKWQIYDMCQQLKYFKCRYTVLLKSKLPVATPFLCDKNHVSCYTLLVTLQELHSLDCSSQHFYTVTTWYTVFPSTIVSDIHNGPRVGIWLSCHLWKGRKPENERWALENQNMHWLGSRFLELYLLDSTSKTFLDSRFPYVGGKFPTYPSNWVIYREYYMYYNKRYFVPQLWGDTFAQNLIFTKICYLLTFFYYMYM